MNNTMNLIRSGGFVVESIAANAPLQTPFLNMQGSTFLHFIIKLENGAGEPVITLEQASDNAGADVTSFRIEHVEICVNADVSAVQNWITDPALNRSAEPMPTTYTPSAATNNATAGNEALIYVRVAAELFTGNRTFVRLNTPGVARAATIIAISPEHQFQGRVENPLLEA